MLFPTSGVKLYPAISLLVVSFFASMGDVSNAFLFLPFQMSFFGLPVCTVAGTALVGNFVPSVFGVIVYKGIGLF
jgi:uncharacterized protein